MNFNLIEGNYIDLPSEKLPDFEKDYLDPSLKSEEVRKKYDLSKKQYSRVTQAIREKYGLIRRPYAHAKHFYRQGNRWYIFKTTKNERIFYGSLPVSMFSETDMETIIKKCRKLSWNIPECMNLIQTLGGTNV